MNWEELFDELDNEDNSSCPSYILDNLGNIISKYVDNEIKDAMKTINLWDDTSWNSGSSQFNSWSSRRNSWEQQKWNQFYGLGGTSVRKKIEEISNVVGKVTIRFQVTSALKLYEEFNRVMSTFVAVMKNKHNINVKYDTEDGELEDLIVSIVCDFDSEIIRNNNDIIKKFLNYEYEHSIVIESVDIKGINKFKREDRNVYFRFYTSNKLDTSYVQDFVNFANSLNLFKNFNINEVGENKYSGYFIRTNPFVKFDDIAYMMFVAFNKALKLVEITYSSSFGGVSKYDGCPSITFNGFDELINKFNSTNPIVHSDKPKKVLDPSKKRYRKCVYNIVKEINEIDGISVKAYIVKKHRGKYDGKRYTLNQSDCELLGIEFDDNLEILPIDLSFGDVYKMIKKES